MFWVGTGQAIRQLIGVITAVLLARLLAPAEFGLIAMAFVAIEFGQIFADVGIGTAIIQRREPEPTAWASAFWLNLAMGTILALLVTATAPAIAAFYGDPRLVWLVVALSASLLVSALQVLPRALLHRAIRFDLVAKTEVAGSIVGAGTAILMALQGAGVWSLAAQPLVTAIVTFALMWLASRWMPGATFQWQAVKPLVHFSLPLLGADILQFLTKNTDRVLIGRFLGGTALGIYGMATQIMLYPMSNVTAVVGKVLFPIFARMQDEHTRLRDAYVKATSAVAAVTFPAMLGLYMVVDDFVPAVFGESWTPMVPVLKILCWVGLTHSITGTLVNVYLATGNTSILWKLGVVATPLTIIGYVAGLPWGVTGIAASYAIVSYVLLYMKLHFALRLIGMPVSRFVWSLRGPFGTSCAMALGVWAIQLGMNGVGVVSPLSRLLIAVTSGAGLYAMLNLALNRAQWTEIYALCRETATRRTGSTDGTC